MLKTADVCHFFVIWRKNPKCS